MLLLWFGFIIVSSTLNYIFTDSPLEGYKTVLLLNIAQTLIFLIPILLKLGDFNDIFEKTEKYILIIAKINCIWCVVQFIAWYVFSFDFNHFFFINVLHGLLGEREWTASYNDSLAVAIRPTGAKRTSRARPSPCGASPSSRKQTTCAKQPPLF